MSNSAIVTGCSSGLGAAFAEELLSRGWKVIGVSRSTDRLPDFTNSDSFVHVVGSVDQDKTADAAFAAAASAGTLRMVINSAGRGVFGEIGSYTADDIHEVLAGNLVGLILFSDRAFNAMRESGGDIVNVMSTASKKLRTAESAYTAAKWGAKAYTRTLRDAAKAQKTKLRVFEVYPCGMRTPFWSEAIRPVADGLAFPSPESISAPVLHSILSSGEAYQQEFTFERS
jgi:NAD(P)-dependent dehydrogenase (short-subunit alcohol dehydrogenase family)